MEGKGWQMVRYADDFVVMSETEEQAKAALEEIAKWVKEAGLTLHPTKTRIVHAAGKGGFDFLGYHFERYGDGVGRKWPRKKSVDKLRETLRPRLRRMQDGSMEEIIARINPVLRGWWAYFKESLPSALENIDGWVRMRLRSIQRRRDKRRGMAYGADHHRYPNRWFAERGLFTLAGGTVRRQQSH
jgi:RNA-directed DNA polymerase